MFERPFGYEPMEPGTSGPFWVHDGRRGHIAENVGVQNAKLIAAAPDMLDILQKIASLQLTKGAAANAAMEIVVRVLGEK